MDSDQCNASISENENMIALLKSENELKHQRIELNGDAIKLAEETLKTYNKDQNGR